MFGSVIDDGSNPSARLCNSAISALVGVLDNIHPRATAKSSSVSHPAAVRPAKTSAPYSRATLKTNSAGGLPERIHELTDVRLTAILDAIDLADSPRVTSLNHNSHGFTGIHLRPSIPSPAYGGQWGDNFGAHLRLLMTAVGPIVKLTPIWVKGGYKFKGEQMGADPHSSQSVAVAILREAVPLGMNPQALARAAGIRPRDLLAILGGYLELTFDDLHALAGVVGIPAAMIVSTTEYAATAAS